MNCALRPGPRLLACSAFLLAMLFLTACATAPYDYAGDRYRCTGQQNQCQRDCANLNDGAGRSACIQRCFSVENQCLTTGFNGAGSSIAIDDAAAEARNQAEKEADFERWKAQKQRERAEEEAADANQ